MSPFYEEVFKVVINLEDQLCTEYPIRVRIYELINKKYKTAAEYYISIVIHHIAFDGWSTNIFLQELEIYYRYYLKHIC